MELVFNPAMLLATAEVPLLTGGGALSGTLSAVSGSVSAEDVSSGDSDTFARPGEFGATVALLPAAFSGPGDVSGPEGAPAPRFATPFSTLVAFRMHTRGCACDAALSAAGGCAVARTDAIQAGLLSKPAMSAADAPPRL